MGVVPPAPGFNEGLRGLCDRHGALLVLDEVLTGFRCSAAGWWGLEGVTPDLFTFGKVMGGGLPAAAFGGRADVMGELAPAGPVYQAGTLSGNPLAMAAGLATLRACTEEVYATLDARAGEVAGIVSAALTQAGVPHRVNRAASLFSVFFADAEVSDYAGARRQSAARYAAFFASMLERGSICRRRVSRPGSCPRPSTTPRSTRSPPPRPRRPWPPHGAARSSGVRTTVLAGAPR